MTRSTKLSEEAMRQPTVENLHPVIRTHPETGRKSLFVNRAFTVRFENMTEDESKPLLEFLYKQATKPEFTCRFHWENGSVAMWDNRCTQHYVLNDFDEERIIQRVTVMGDRPEGVAPPRWEPYARARLAAATSRYDGQLNRYLGRRATTLESNRRKED